MTNLRKTALNLTLRAPGKPGRAASAQRHTFPATPISIVATMPSNADQSIPMISRQFRISNKFGLHARPSVQLTKAACRFRSDVFVCRNGCRANAKSIIHVMMLAAPCGSTVLVEAHGPDEEAAVVALGQLIDSCFGEP
jgi:phosphocarrier protein HPr